MGQLILPPANLHNDFCIGVSGAVTVAGTTTAIAAAAAGVNRQIKSLNMVLTTSSAAFVVASMLIDGKIMGTLSAKGDGGNDHYILPYQILSEGLIVQVSATGTGFILYWDIVYAEYTP